MMQGSRETDAASAPVVVGCTAPGVAQATEPSNYMRFAGDGRQGGEMDLETSHQPLPVWLDPAGERWIPAAVDVRGSAYLA
jgi:hypothetical protein